MQFKLKDHVRRIGQNEVGTIRDIHEPEEYILRLNPYAETMYHIQLGEGLVENCLWVTESKLELVKWKEPA